jgi:hypothetical protein
MKALENRYLQLNLRLTNASPTVMAGEKNEELLLAIMDLLLEAIASDDGVESAPGGRDEDAR